MARAFQSSTERHSPSNKNAASSAAFFLASKENLLRGFAHGRGPAFDRSLHGKRDYRIHLVAGVDLHGAVDIARLRVLGHLKRDFEVAFLRELFDRGGDRSNA